jgi:hypothetical protein
MLRGSTAIPMVRVFALLGYVLVAWLVVDVSAALWQVQNPLEIIGALRWIFPLETRRCWRASSLPPFSKTVRPA